MGLVTLAREVVAYLASEPWAMLWPMYELHGSDCPHHSSYQAERSAYRLAIDQMCQQLNMALHYLVTYKAIALIRKELRFPSATSYRM